MQIESEKSNLTLHTRLIDTKQSLNRSLNQLINEIDVLLALPDPIIHNKKNIPFLLLTSYRYNIPMIAFSKTYVNAGAIAAIYSTSIQIVKQIVELSRKILYTPHSLKTNNFSPKYYSISYNKNVANSLGIHLYDPHAITAKLIAQEK